jgi:hypothetical protein
MIGSLYDDIQFVYAFCDVSAKRKIATCSGDRKAEGKVSL